MMIRAGKRDEVLTSDSMWMCTSCYNCIVRCPRELPITHIMHGLAHYAKRLGIVPQGQPTATFAQLFWDNPDEEGPRQRTETGHRPVLQRFGEGMKTALKNKDIGLAMGKAKRLNPMEFFGGHCGQRLSGLQKVIKKAQELEDARLAKHGG